MISVDQAIARIARAFAPLGPETVPVGEAAGRVLAEDAVARMDQPPAPMSAMDGYAVRTADASAGAELAVIGEAPAGRPYRGRVGAGQAVRIFTGGVVPEGADAVVIQEDTSLSPKGGEGVHIKEAPRIGENVRARGLDFWTGETLLPRGHRVSARDVALLAAGDLAEVSVTRKPRVAIVATGDELSRPGELRKDGGIVASSTYALQAMVRAMGRRGLRHRHPAGQAGSLRRSARGDEDGRSDRDARRRIGRRPRSGAERAEAARLRARFLADRDAARQAADLRAVARYAVHRPSRKSRFGNGVRGSLHPACDRRDARDGVSGAGCDGAAWLLLARQRQAAGLHPCTAHAARRRSDRRTLSRCRIPRCRRFLPRPTG